MTRAQAHRLALAAIGLVAFVGVESPHFGTTIFLVGLLVVCVVAGAGFQWWDRRTAVLDTPQKQAQSLVNTKRILLAMLAIGVAAFFGGRATMATFSAETANVGSSAASGSLTMANLVNDANQCDSFGTGSNGDNTNSTCYVPLTLQNVAPGAFAGAPAKITIKNTGSIDARSFYVFSAYANATLAGAVNSGDPATGATITTTPVEGTFNVGDTLTISYGLSATPANNLMSCLVGGTSPVGAEGGATSVTLGTCTPSTWNQNYPIGARIIDNSSNTTATNTDCYDQQTTSSTVSGATYGTQLNFNEVPPSPTAHTTPTNGMCQKVLVWIQEQSSSGKNYCWYGNGSGTARCAAPISANLTAGGSISGATTTLSVAALRGNVIGTATHDTIKITEGNLSTTCSAQADAYINDTSITVSGCSPTNTFTTAAVVTDTTTLSTLNSDTTHTLSNFDTSTKWQVGQIPLYTVSGNGSVNNPSAIELNKHGDSGDTRIFYVGVYLPATSGSADNYVQGLKSTFGLAWHIDQ